MLSKVEKTKELFKPIKLVLTFEAQQELNAFLCLFEKRSITNFLESHNIHATCIGQQLLDAGAEMPNLTVDNIWQDFLWAARK